MSKESLWLLFLLAFCACDQESSETTPHASATIPSASATARRPSRRYLLTRQGGQCEVFWVDGDTSSEKETIPCPPDLNDGEQIRLTGRTCLREGGPPARTTPVVCPDPVTNLEKYERGELKRK